MGTYGIAIAESGTDWPTGAGHVDTDKLREDLAEIRDSLSPVLEEEPGNKLALSELEIGLTLSAEGKLLFIATAGVEATITLTFSRPTSG
jgi:hypothetical protein